MISNSGLEMSLVKIMYGLVFLPKFNLIIHHYCTYINVFILVHLSIFLDCFDRFHVSPLHTEEGRRSVRKLCVLTCVSKVDLKDITLSRLCHHIYIYICIVEPRMSNAIRSINLVDN